MKRLVCFHLFNDYSGSPKVLRMVLERLAEKEMQIDLVTSKGEGALNDLNKYENIHFCGYSYRFSSNPVITLLRYICVQVYIFFFSFRYLFSKGSVFYINTILPVGAALAGRIMGKKVIYHYHENAFVKGTFYRILAGLMQILATRIICVSNYQKSFLRRTKDVYVVANAVPTAFAKQLCPNPEKAFVQKRILMLGSLKRYKGTLEFMELARQLKDYRFELVLNETEENVEVFRKENQMDAIDNLTIYSRQKDVAPFYNRASIVLNLSDKSQFIETFGLTALEAMSAGLPVIVPTVGGIAEMVTDGVNGYKIDVHDIDKIAAHICLILSNRSLYCRLANNALTYSQNFSIGKMSDAVLSLLDG